MIRNERVTEKISNKIKKLTPFETYIALIKGYCVMTIIMIPKGFQTGGWLVSGIMLAISGILTTVCVTKLVESGLKVNLFSYSLVTQRAFGKKGRAILDFMVAATQYSFTISHMTFLVTSMKSTMDFLFAADTNPIIYAAIVVIILTPMAWVRNIAKFSFTFLIGNFLILLTVSVTSIYAFSIMSD